MLLLHQVFWLRQTVTLAVLLQRSWVRSESITSRRNTSASRDRAVTAAHVCERPPSCTALVHRPRARLDLNPRTTKCRELCPHHPSTPCPRAVLSGYDEREARPWQDAPRCPHAGARGEPSPLPARNHALYSLKPTPSPTCTASTCILPASHAIFFASLFTEPGGGRLCRRPEHPRARVYRRSRGRQEGLCAVLHNRVPLLT